VKNENGTLKEIRANEGKAEALVKSFFSRKPTGIGHQIPEGYMYLPPLDDPDHLTEERIHRHIRKLSPYKVPGPDGISNIVLQKSAKILVPILLRIYNAILLMEEYPDQWRIFTTVVLRKPGKPTYDVPKAYRPIALLNTMGKVLMAIIAEEISNVIEKEGLLPTNHFGGRPGCTTTDAVHLLIHRIKDAWHGGKVASVLFLDVEGAFPNAVTKRVIHNLKRRGIPSRHIEYVANLLDHRLTQLKFDNYLSQPMTINNGIGQGDPLLMILYIIYNADLIEIAEGNQEESLGYVDDAIVIAEGENFHDTTSKIEDIMNRQGGAFDWSLQHNSNFEISKLAIMHAAQKRRKNKRTVRLPCPVLKLHGTEIKEVNSYKYLGIHVDYELCWDIQSQNCTTHATKYLLAYR